MRMLGARGVSTDLAYQSSRIHKQKRRKRPVKSGLDAFLRRVAELMTLGLDHGPIAGTRQSVDDSRTSRREDGIVSFLSPDRALRDVTQIDYQVCFGSPLQHCSRA